MTVLTLQIRFHPTALRDTQAWFLPGDCAAEWLRELGTWDVSHADVVLRAVPRSMTDRTPLGALVTVTGRQPSRVSPWLRPYGTIARRVFLPVEARLEPSAEEHELIALLDSETEYVWHPVAGLVSFPSGELLTIAGLIDLPALSNADWTRAEPGEAFSRRLVSVTATRPPSIDVILESGRDGIGTESAGLNTLPPFPGERKPGLLGKAAMLPLFAAAKLMQWITHHAPGGADRETWVDRLQQWAAKVLSPDWQSARERELKRLMNLLADDPDQGLKYALPMGGDAGRGIANASANLAMHNVDFRLSTPSGPTDYWDVPPHLLHDLTARYRELADREIRLGRHRRAAYIYAELLDDLPAAAAALKAGGYFREAAVLYEERLHRPGEAAACLEEGGLWNEAIILHEKLNQHEAVGRIYRRLEQHPSADAAYRKAVEYCRDRGDLLKAAKLLTEELRDSHAAVIVLRHGWPDSTQAAACLRQELRLLGQLGRHADAGQRIAELREQPVLPDRTPELAEVLADSAGDYPDATVCAVAADATRIVVSRRLVQAPSAADRRLLAAIEKLAPEDRLLSRDCERFQRRTPVAAPQKRIAAASVPEPERVLQTRLDSGVNWICGAASNRYFYAAGFYQRQILVVRREWATIDDVGMTVQWNSPAIDDQPILLAPSPNDSADVWVQLTNGPPLPERRFAAGEMQRSARTPSWSDRAVALEQSPHGVSWMLAAEGNELIAKAFSEKSLPILTRQVASDWSRDLRIPVPMHARSDGAYFGIGDVLKSVDARDIVNCVELPDEIIGLSGSIPHSRVRVAASFSRGGAVVWKDTLAVRPFADDLSRPLTAFTVSGHLVAVDADRIEVYRSERQQLTMQFAGASPGEPLAVLPVRRNEFAVLDRSGGLTMYRIPANWSARMPTTAPPSSKPRGAA